MLSILQYKANSTEYELSFHISQEENLWEDVVIIATEIVVEIIVEILITVVILITAVLGIVALIIVVLATADLVTIG